MVVISGILGTVTAVWLYNNFVGWLNILNCTLPPVGMIVVLGYFCHKEEYEKWDVIPRQVNWFAIAGVLIGAAVANLVPWGHRFCQRYGYCSGMLPRWRTGRTEEEKMTLRELQLEKQLQLNRSEERVRFGSTFWIWD